jgi:hypothetical protein
MMTTTRAAAALKEVCNADTFPFFFFDVRVESVRSTMPPKVDSCG